MESCDLASQLCFYSSLVASRQFKASKWLKSSSVNHKYLLDNHLLIILPYALYMLCNVSIMIYQAHYFTHWLLLPICMDHNVCIVYVHANLNTLKSHSIVTGWLFKIAAKFSLITITVWWVLTYQCCNSTSYKASLHIDYGA